MPLLTVVLAGDADEAARLQGPELPDLEVLTRGGRSGAAATTSGSSNPARRAEALAGVAEALRAAQPTSARGRRRPEQLLGRVARDGVTTLDRRPGLAVAPGLGDKVLRRDFIRGLGVAIGDGPGGELASRGPRCWPPTGSPPPAAARLRAARQRRHATAASRHTSRCSRSSTPIPAPAGDAGSSPPRCCGASSRLDRLGGAERAPTSRAVGGLAPPARRRAPRQARRDLKARLVERSDRRAFALVHTALRGRALARRARVLRQRCHQAARAARPLPARHRPIDPQLAVFAAYWYRGYAYPPSTRRPASSCPACAAWVVDPRAPRRCRTASSTSCRHPRVLRRARPRASSSTTSTSPTTTSSARGRCTCRPITAPLKFMGTDLKTSAVAANGLRGAAAPRALGLQHHLQPLLDRGLGARLPDPVRVAPGTRATTCSPSAGGDRSPAARGAGRGPGPGRDLRADASQYWPTYALLDVGSPSRSARTTSCSCARTTSTTRIPARRATPPGRVRDVAAYASVEELCLAADVLMTDYSSIMFDFGMTARSSSTPRLGHLPELRSCSTSWRAPGIVTTTAAEVVGRSVRRGLGRGRGALRAEFRARFCTSTTPRRERGPARVARRARAHTTRPGGLHPMSAPGDRRLILVGRSGAGRVLINDSRPRPGRRPAAPPTTPRRTASCATGSAPSCRARRRLVKDPRTVWFVPLWALPHELGAALVRDNAPPPGRGADERAQVLRRVADAREPRGVAQRLARDRAPDPRRAFIRFDLLADWRREVGRMGGLPNCRCSPGRRRPRRLGRRLRRPGLHRTVAGRSFPAPVRAMADSVWERWRRSRAAGDEAADGARRRAATSRRSTPRAIAQSRSPPQAPRPRRAPQPPAAAGRRAAQAR